MSQQLSKRRVEDILVKLKKKFPDVINAWIGKRTVRRRKVGAVLVAIALDVTCLPNKFEGLDVVARRFQTVNCETVQILDQVTSNQFSFRRHELSRLNTRFSKSVRHLFKYHSNITTIGISPFRSKGFPEKHKLVRKTCIIINVSVKGVIPFGERSFPRRLVGIQTDIREDFFDYGTTGPIQDSFSSFSCLPIGCAISTEKLSETYGTLGGFVDSRNGELCAITCSHVVLDKKEMWKERKKLRPVRTFPECVNELEGQKRKYVFQPYPKRGTDPETDCIGESLTVACGSTSGCKRRRKFGIGGRVGVDAALIKLTRRLPIAGSFALPSWALRSLEEMAGIQEFNTGNILTSFEKRHCECRVFKVGASTGLTFGQLVSDTNGPKMKTDALEVMDRSANIQYKNFKLYNQLVVLNILRDKNGKIKKDIKGKYKPAFADKGDSGSLVFLVDRFGTRPGVYCVGMIVGLTSTEVLITPIWAVLKSLGLSPEGLKVFTRERIVQAGADEGHRLLALSGTPGVQ